MLPCVNACGEILRFLRFCFSISIGSHFMDEAVRNHFARFDCRSPESYYVGYDERYFLPVDMHCIDLPPGKYHFWYTSYLCSS